MSHVRKIGLFYLVLSIASAVAACGSPQREQQVSAAGLGPGTASLTDDVVAAVDQVAPPSHNGPSLDLMRAAAPPMSHQMHTVECTELPRAVTEGAARLADDGHTIECVVVRNDPGSAEEILALPEWEVGIIITAEPLTDDERRSRSYFDLYASGGTILFARPVGAWAVTTPAEQPSAEGVAIETVPVDTVAARIGSTDVHIRRTTLGTASLSWTSGAGDPDLALDLFTGSAPSDGLSVASTFLGSSEVTIIRS